MLHFDHSFGTWQLLLAAICLKNLVMISVLNFVQKVEIQFLFFVTFQFIWQEEQNSLDVNFIHEKMLHFPFWKKEIFDWMKSLLLGSKYIYGWISQVLKYDTKTIPKIRSISRMKFSLWYASNYWWFIHLMYNFLNKISLRYISFISNLTKFL